MANHLKLDKKLIEESFNFGVDSVAVYVVPLSDIAERGQKYILSQNSRVFGKIGTQNCYPAFKIEDGSFLPVGLYKKWKSEAENEPLVP